MFYCSCNHSLFYIEFFWATAYNIDLSENMIDLPLHFALQLKFNFRKTRTCYFRVVNSANLNAYITRFIEAKCIKTNVMSNTSKKKGIESSEESNIGHVKWAKTADKKDASFSLILLMFAATKKNNNK